MLTKGSIRCANLLDWVCKPKYSSPPLLRDRRDGDEYKEKEVDRKIVLHTKSKSCKMIEAIDLFATVNKEKGIEI